MSKLMFVLFTLVLSQTASASHYRGYKLMGLNCLGSNGVRYKIYPEGNNERVDTILGLSSKTFYGNSYVSPMNEFNLPFYTNGYGLTGFHLYLPLSPIELEFQNAVGMIYRTTGSMLFPIGSITCSVQYKKNY